jgi:hypothetical protein
VLGTHAQEPTIDIDVLMGLVMEAWVQEQTSSDQRIGDLFRWVFKMDFEDGF